MKIRWAVAAVAASALALLTLSTPLPIFDIAQAADGVCDANAKPANLTFALKDVNNRTVKLSDYRGKVIVLDFWATWCGPCKIEIPGFVDLQNRYGKDGLQVIGVSVDDESTIKDLAPFVEQFKMNYPVLKSIGHEDIQDAYGPMFGIPTTVLISRDGKVCKKHIGMAEKAVFEKEIKALL
jgi:thiol-disulfide isomerase/thioredoxin